MRDEGNRPSGMTGKETDMTTLVRSRTQSGILPILAAALLGLGLVFTGGLAQSAVLHDAAHDARHSFGFPCH